MLKDCIHLDHVLNFGALPSPGIFGRVADALAQIFMYCGIKAIIKWVDNFIFICYPYCHLPDGTFQFKYSADLIWNIAAEFGWPWAPEKFVDFSPTFNYIGFTWHFSTKIVKLPDKKKEKYLKQILSWTCFSMHTLKEAEIIIGTLNHVCLVVPEGHSHLVSLYRF
jgi:hypothetical protein